MTQYRSQGKKLYLCFIDFRKAFDRVWRAGLLLKILNIGIGGKLYNVIKNMYSDNMTSVKLENICSKYFECSVGVRQGDGLSPTLFNIYVNDLKDILNDPICCPAKYGNLSIGLLKYADDLVIISERSTIRFK